MIRRVFGRSSDQRGGVLVLVALAMVVLIGFAALVIDIGHLLVVRNELHNSADAAALAGASYLYPQIPPSSPSPPAWETATTQATIAIGLNKSDGVTVTPGTVQVGYWDFASPPPGPTYTLKSTGITPIGPDYYAAVQVTVTKNVRNFFAPVIGIDTSDVSATATAVMASPGKAFEGSLMPFAISEEAKKQLEFNQEFAIGDSDVNGVKNCTHNGIPVMCGQWTTLLENEGNPNSQSWINGLITGTNSSPPLSIGDPIMIVPGQRNSGYKEVEQNLIGHTVLLPVVKSLDPSEPDIPDSNIADDRNITGFVCFYISDVIKHGIESYITGHMVSSCSAGGTSGIGPNYGAYAPPRLVQ